MYEIIFVILAIIYIIFSQLKSKHPRPRAHTQYGVISYTQKGETVRSYAEKRLADYFDKNGILYKYEPELRGIRAHPDFYLPEYGVYVEYWGLVDADDPEVKARYVKGMKIKMAKYYKNNISFISIYPKNLENIDWIFRKKFEDVMGYRFPR